MMNVSNCAVINSDLDYWRKYACASCIVILVFLESAQCGYQTAFLDLGFYCICKFFFSTKLEKKTKCPSLEFFDRRIQFINIS